MHRDTIVRFCNATTAELESKQTGATVLLAGLMSRVQITTARSGRSAGSRMAQLTIADRSGTVDGVIFPEAFAEFGHLLQPEAIVILCGTVDRSRGPTNIIVDQVFAMETAGQYLAEALELSFEEAADDGEPLQPLMQMVAGTLRQAAAMNGGIRGRAVPVRLRVPTGDTYVELRCGRNFVVVPDRPLLDRLTQLLGEPNVLIHGGHVPTRERRGGWRGREGANGANGANGRAPRPAMSGAH